MTNAGILHTGLAFLGGSLFYNRAGYLGLNERVGSLFNIAELPKFQSPNNVMGKRQQATLAEKTPDPPAQDRQVTRLGNSSGEEKRMVQIW